MYRNDTLKTFGFTLIELIIVLMIVGVLAATALPKFINLGVDARNSSVNTLRGAASSAASLIYAKAVLSNKTGASDSMVLDDGTKVYLAYGYPSAKWNGIGAALNIASVQSGSNGAIGYIQTSSTSILLGVQGNGNCAFTYNQATASSAPVITAPSGC